MWPLRSSLSRVRRQSQLQLKASIKARNPLCLTPPSLRLVDLSGGAVNDGHGLAGVVHEQLLTRSMVLAHHQVQLALPGPVVLTEPAVLLPFWVRLPVLLPEQEQSDVFTLQFIVNLLPVRYAPDLSRQVWRGREQQLLQLSLTQILRQWPAQGWGVSSAFHDGLLKHPDFYFNSKSIGSCLGWHTGSSR